MNKKFTWKINLLNLNDKSIIRLLFLMKEKKFYYALIMNQIHKKSIKKTTLFKNINKNTKNMLTKLCTIQPLDIKQHVISYDNTVKWLIKINTNIIETVAIPNRKNHFTLCVSSQIGCMLNCSFCYTAKNGFFKNIKTSEIISQILIAKDHINEIYPQKKITNIVFMGMGEPLLNIKNVLSAIDIIKNKNSYNIHTNKITISTSGIAEKIHLLNDYKLPLALSLHATEDRTRSLLMPINKHYPIKNILDVCKTYAETNKFTIEYIMLKNINDSEQDALRLKTLLKGIKCKICLIPFNNFYGTSYKSTAYSDILIFQKILKNQGIITTIRKKLGNDINAACGQLAGNFQDKTNRSNMLKHITKNV